MVRHPLTITRPRYAPWRAHHIIVVFYGLYALLALAGNLLIDYPGISTYTMLVITAYVMALFLGAYLGSRQRFVYIKLGWFIDSEKVALWLAIALTLSLAYSWYLMTLRFGSLQDILSNASLIRQQLLDPTESPVVPVYLGYFNSLVRAPFALSLALAGNKRGARYVALAAYCFALVFLNDLLLFGRAGIVFGAFCVVGFFAVFKVWKLVSVRSIALMISLFILAMAPRLIRAFDNFDSSLTDVRPYLKHPVPAALNVVINAYTYYWSSPYALDVYLTGTAHEFTYGYRTFAAPIRFITRIWGGENVSQIDELSFIPFAYNLYTAVWDYYSDFGLLGILIIPGLIGFYMGTLFNARGVVEDALKIYMMGWLLFTPVNHAFSWAHLFIGFAFLLVAGLFSPQAAAREARQPRTVAERG